MGKFVSTFLLLFGLAAWATGQTDTRARLRETGATLLDKNVTDEQKLANAARFLQGLDEEISENGPDWVTAETLPFVSHLSSDDKLTQIFTWTLKRAEDSYLAYGLVWNKDKKTGEVKTFRLEDKGETLKNTEVKNLGRNSWLGCVYYSITDMSKGNKRMYLLLGYGGNTPQVRRKVAEILTFNNVGEVQFGAPVFETPKRKFNRVVLEYNAQATVAMKFDPETQTLFYDYLVPVSELYIGNPAFYGPNGSYDGFKLKAGRLLFIKDADARNPTEGFGNRSKPVERKLPPR